MPDNAYVIKQAEHFDPALSLQENISQGHIDVLTISLEDPRIDNARAAEQAKKYIITPIKITAHSKEGRELYVPVMIDASSIELREMLSIDGKKGEDTARQDFEFIASMFMCANDRINSSVGVFAAMQTLYHNDVERELKEVSPSLNELYQILIGKMLQHVAESTFYGRMDKLPDGKNSGQNSAQNYYDVYRAGQAENSTNPLTPNSVLVMNQELLDFQEMMLEAIKKAVGYEKENFLSCSQHIMKLPDTELETISNNLSQKTDLEEGLLHLHLNSNDWLAFIKSIKHSSTLRSRFEKNEALIPYVRSDVFLGKTTRGRFVDKQQSSLSGNGSPGTEKSSTTALSAATPDIDTKTELENFNRFVEKFKSEILEPIHGKSDELKKNHGANPEEYTAKLVALYQEQRSIISKFIDDHGQVLQHHAFGGSTAHLSPYAVMHAIYYTYLHIKGENHNFIAGPSGHTGKTLRDLLVFATIYPDQFELAIKEKEYIIGKRPDAFADYKSFYRDFIGRLVATINLAGAHSYAECYYVANFVMHQVAELHRKIRESIYEEMRLLLKKQKDPNITNDTRQENDNKLLELENALASGSHLEIDPTLGPLVKISFHGLTDYFDSAKRLLPKNLFGSPSENSYADDMALLTDILLKKPDRQATETCSALTNLITHQIKTKNVPKPMKMIGVETAATLGFGDFQCQSSTNTNGTNGFFKSHKHHKRPTRKMHRKSKRVRAEEKKEELLVEERPKNNPAATASKP